MGEIAPLPVADGIDLNCWKKIGIRGDKSCEALSIHAHCRNCPTYSRIAASLLHRRAVVEDAGDWTHHYGDAVDAEEASTATCVIVRLGMEWLGIAPQALEEVVELRSIHSLPHRRNPALLGIVNVHGELVLCVSLDRLLGIATDPPHAEGSKRRLLILRCASGRLAVPVDEVQHTHDYRASDIAPLPATLARSANAFSVGLLTWRGHAVALMDDARLVQAFEEALA